MRYRGREIDPVALWENYVDFPNNLQIAGDYLPKVVCPNPAHDTFKRHFQINVSQPTVHCFAGCGISGNYEHALCLVTGLYEKFKVQEAKSEPERRDRERRARKEARRFILKHQRLGKAAQPSRASHSYVRRTTEITRPVDSLEYATFLPQAGRSFLEGRGITNESISKWELGWMKDELRVVIPAKDFDGRLRFLIRRATREKDQPKYLYTEGFPKNSLLFGACYLDLSLVRSFGLVLVEGSIDTIINDQHEIPTGGILGTGISKAQCRIIARLRPKRIYLMFDKDTAGVQNIQIASQKLRKYPMMVCRYPKGKSDPAELTRKEAQRSLDRSVPLSTWMHQNFPNAIRPKAKVLSG